MKDVTLLIMQGLNLTKDCFIEQYCLVDRDTSISTFHSAQLLSPFKWADILDGLIYATQATTHDRYWSWYYNLANTINNSEEAKEYVEVTSKHTVDEVEIDTP